jgi:glycosyltransferase involved in cell wall biosynthesis
MAHDGRSAARAINEMKQNPRYVWKGEVPGWQVRQELKHSHLMVISSKAEGGANVVSEAVVAGVPIIASEIEGNIGLLGNTYGGYYPVGDTNALRDLMLKTEASREFVERLEAMCHALLPRFTIEQEHESWHKLIAKLT